MTGILITVVYKPLRHWVDDHPLLYGNNGNLDPSTYNDHLTTTLPWPLMPSTWWKVIHGREWAPKPPTSQPHDFLIRPGGNGGHWRRWGILRFPWYQFGRRSVEIHVLFRLKESYSPLNESWEICHVFKMSCTQLDCFWNTNLQKRFWGYCSQLHLNQSTKSRKWQGYTAKISKK